MIIALIAGCGGKATGSKTRPDARTTFDRTSACLRNAGFAVKRATPSPGDTDAPNVELVSQGRNTTAFIGFYTDSGQAKRSLPSIERNATRAHGVVEHRTLVAISFFPKPSTEAKRRVTKCAF